MRISVCVCVCASILLCGQPKAFCACAGRIAFVLSGCLLLLASVLLVIAAGIAARTRHVTEDGAFSQKVE